MNVFKTIIALFVFLSQLITGSVSFVNTPQEPEMYSETIMFASDFQGADRESNFSAILNAADGEYPGMAVFGGDYQSSFGGGVTSAFGINQLKKAVSDKWSYDMQYIFAQGNHDPASAVGLNKSGAYEFENYIIYVLCEDDFPWQESPDIGSIKENKVKATAQELNDVLAAYANADESRPVFIVSHVPLHYSARTSGTDNKYASYIFDAINSNAENLDIVFLFGHNHSGDYDDYIGGAVNFLDKGDTMYIGGSNEARTLGFVYTNCGYIGYTNNSQSDTSSNALSVTFATVSGTQISLRKYSKDGQIAEHTIQLKSNLAAVA